jgi:hypothetical protein
MEFSRENVGELQYGRQHGITIHLPTGQITTTSFNVIMRVIPPTPTPVIEYAYSVTGVLLYTNVNTTSRYNYSEAHATVPTTAATPRPSVTEPIPAKLGDRTIAQGMTVYIGEKNLDIWAAVGWRNETGGNKAWQIAHWDYGQDFYELPARIISIENVWNFDVSEEMFAGHEGEWYMWEGWYEPKTPVAFVVKRLPQEYNITVVPVQSEVTVLTTTATTVATAVTTTVTRPVTTHPTEMQVNVPLPGWVAVAAVLMIVMIRKR